MISSENNPDSCSSVRLSGGCFASASARTASDAWYGGKYRLSSLRIFTSSTESSPSVALAATMSTCFCSRAL